MWVKMSLPQVPGAGDGAKPHCHLFSSPITFLHEASVLGPRPNPTARGCLRWIPSGWKAEMRPSTLSSQSQELARHHEPADPHQEVGSDPDPRAGGSSEPCPQSSCALLSPHPRMGSIYPHRSWEPLPALILHRVTSAPGTPLVCPGPHTLPEAGHDWCPRQHCPAGVTRAPFTI